MNTKSVKVQGHDYVVRRMDPIPGGYIYMRMMGALMAQAQEGDSNKADVVNETTPEQRARILISLSFMRGLSYEDAQFACRNALLVAAEAGTSIPVMASDGRWASPELADNPAAAQDLVMESLIHSLTPFFARSGSSTAPGSPSTTSL